jgi:putative transposase
MLKGKIVFNWVNPIRTGLVDRPENYRWNSLGYHVQTTNKDKFLSLDFGLKEFGVLDPEERLKGYRRYVYEAGALDRPQKDQGREIKNNMVEHERKNDFELNRIRRFRYRTRYFTDSGIIGTKEFVSENYRGFLLVELTARREGKNRKQIITTTITIYYQTY